MFKQADVFFLAALIILNGNLYFLEEISPVLQLVCYFYVVGYLVVRLLRGLATILRTKNKESEALKAEHYEDLR